MALATQCPHCKTTFKVAHDQLKLRSGLVRCGACKQIFNGIEHLVPPDQPAATSEKIPPPPAPIEVPPHADTTMLADADMAAGKAGATEIPPSGIEALEFIPVDDPETQTRILSPEPAPEPEEKPEPTAPAASPLPAIISPAAESDDDPLTRMTLVDFSVFNEGLNEEEPPKKNVAPADAAPPSKDEIWPDTQDGLPDSSDLTLPRGLVEDTLSPDTLAGPVPPAEEALYNARAEEHVTATEREAPAVAAEPVPEPASADKAGEDFTDDARQEALAAEEDIANDDEPTFVRHGRRRQRWGRAASIFMAIASLLLLAAALGQTAYAFRDQLAARFPQAKPALIQLCELAGCQVSLPAQIEQVSIESNELQAQANNKNVFTLSLLLHNRSAVAQAWPHVELTLNDKNGNPLVRRTLAPRDYLPSDKLLSQGLAARSEQAVTVSFELSHLQASDYRVYLFYP